MESSTPSRRQLLPKLTSHVDYLASSLDQRPFAKTLGSEALTTWIAKNYRTGQSLSIIVICTGNSRRSILGSTMGNIAAAYCGLPEIKFFSGGTHPTAFNSRTVRALREIGVEIESLGIEAARGEETTANPMYRVTWGIPGSNFEMTEYSKKYDAEGNPQRDFAALLVCGEADAGCPFVLGADCRISMPCPDPKDFDGHVDEVSRYAERRDEMGRMLLAIMIEVVKRIKA